MFQINKKKLKVKFLKSILIADVNIFTMIVGNKNEKKIV